MRKLLLLMLSMFYVPGSVLAATYYLSTTGNDSNSGSSISPWVTLSKAFGMMTAGDILVVRDGVYAQRMLNMPSGTASSYTTIKAEHDGLAIFQITSQNPVLSLSEKSYVRIEGFKFVCNAVDGTSDVAYISAGSHHNKIMRCGFVKTPTTTQQNVANFTLSGSNNLLEECWAWGGGRYKFVIFGGDSLSSGSNNILRRCVVRHDREYSGGFNPQAAFANYQGKNNIFQNCIVVDSNFPCSWEGAAYSAQPYYDSWRGPWFLEKGQKGGSLTIEGCVAIGFSGTFVTDSPSGVNSDPMYTAGPLTFRNCVAINGYNGIPIYYNHPNRPITVDHCVIANMSGKQQADSQLAGFAFTGANTANAQAVATNSIFFGMTSTAFGGGGGLFHVTGQNDYNSFYNNTHNYLDSMTGAHDVTGVNPTAASLRYPLRIESGTPLKGTGSIGTDIGPLVIKKIGVSGTLYGETGYNTETDENLWPFPNEDRIRTDMRSYPSNWPAGNLPSPTRGFCADGQTLTKYIWEYLGNTMPADLYGSAIFPPSGLTATPASSSSIFLTWQDNSSNETRFNVERKVGVAGAYSVVGVTGANVATFMDTGLSPSVVYYYRVKAYNDTNASGYSDEATATIGGGGTSGDNGGDGGKKDTGRVKIIGPGGTKKGVLTTGDTAQIQFESTGTGRFECKVFTLSGEPVWQDTMDNVSQGTFTWVPKNLPSGGYVIAVKGPGIDVKKKIAILR